MIEAITATLGLPDEALELTWRSLAEVGNLSSASVLHVLRDTMAKRPPEGSPGLMMAMGPGSAPSSSLLRVAADPMIWYVLLIAAIAVERVVELIVSKRNWEWSRARGGTEFGAGHYPAMVVLHTALLVGCLVEVFGLHRPFIPALGWPMLAVVVAAQGLRWWCITTLGHQWNTRVIVVPGRAARDRRARTGCCRIRTTSRWCSRASRCRSCTRPGSPPLVFTVAQRGSAAHPDQGRERGAGEPDVIDLLVAGGGPAGSGHRTATAHEQGSRSPSSSGEAGALDKACGEGMMPHTIGIWTRLGVQPTGRPLRGISYLDGNRTGRRAVPRRARTRCAQDRAARVRFWRRRRSAGVQLVHGRRRRDHARTRRRCGPGELQREVPGGGGRTALTDSPVTGPVRSRRRARAGGASAGTCEIAPWTESVEVHWAPGAEAYVTPVADDCVGIAILS